MTRLCLIRHGQTDWNLEGRYQGQSDVLLNEAGRLQARQLAERLVGQELLSIYSSDLRRARDTAMILARRLLLPVYVDTRLREINQGDWEGQKVEVIRARYTKLWEMRAEDPASVRPPGGETVEEVAIRVHQALDEISSNHPGVSVMIVSHGLALATALCAARGIPVGLAYSLIPENADPVWIEWK
jgi:broad specificity phosphatase PhoE